MSEFGKSGENKTWLYQVMLLLSIHSFHMMPQAGSIVYGFYSTFTGKHYVICNKAQRLKSFFAMFSIGFVFFLNHGHSH